MDRYATPSWSSNIHQTLSDCIPSLTLCTLHAWTVGNICMVIIADESLFVGDCPGSAMRHAVWDGNGVDGYQNGSRLVRMGRATNATARAF